MNHTKRNFFGRIGLSGLIVGAAALGLVAVAGCASNPSKSHVVRIVGTGTKIGVAQNPATQCYELGILRAQVELTTIPVFYTNGVCYMPDVVSRYEVSTHNPIFGNLALTSTMATGTNGVTTQVGGATPPINTGFGTGAQIAINWPTNVPVTILPSTTTTNK
jgi:hypothetical protein